MDKLRDMMNVALTPSERARHARAEIEAIVAALRVDELAQIVALGRRLLEGEAHDTLRSARDRDHR